MEQGLYIAAFLDFQKHGKRNENALLRTLSQIEIKEAQFRLDLITKQMMAKRSLYMCLTWPERDHTQYKSESRSIAVYDVDKDDFEKNTLEDLIKNSTIWDDNGELKIKK
jgi:hypothetical protein